MANDVLYEVRITFDFKENTATLVFRSDCVLEQAVQLANSLWLSTNNSDVEVTVCANNSVIPIVVFHCR